MTEATALAAVNRFWQLMASNDFYAVSAVLADDFVLEWPQSNERVRGADRFGQLNTEYPAHGPWRFTINRVVAAENEAVTDVTVTDGAIEARAISFFTVVDGKITRLVEYWPAPYPAPDNRAHLVEPIT